MDELQQLMDTVAGQLKVLAASQRSWPHRELVAKIANALPGHNLGDQLKAAMDSPGDAVPTAILRATQKLDDAKRSVELYAQLRDSSGPGNPPTTVVKNDALRALKQAEEHIMYVVHFDRDLAAVLTPPTQHLVAHDRVG